MISIGAFSLALEPWMGAGFVLAALVPPKKRVMPRMSDITRSYVMESFSAQQAEAAGSEPEPQPVWWN